MKNPAVITGLAIGDALGMPFEFCNHEYIEGAQWECEYRAGKPDHRTLNAGQWTDDTKMAICIARSLVDNGEFDLEDIAEKYTKWFLSGDLRGIGIQTQWAITNILDGTPLEKCGNIMRKEKPSFRKDGRIASVCGNGTAMRIAPLGLFFKNDPVSLFKYSMEDAVLTHNHPDAKDASLAVAYIVGLLVNGEHPLTAVEEATALLGPGNVKDKLIESKRLANENKNWDQALVLGTDGTAHETVGSAVFSFLRFAGDGFKHIVCNSVRMGGDTDTRAAIAGAFAGAYLGAEGIPKEYLDDLEHAEMLIAFDKVLSVGPRRKEYYER